jgi:hypothetical protein
LTVTGNTVIGNIGAPYVPSTSTSTGVLTVRGGVGVTGNLYVGSNVVITGSISKGSGTFDIPHPIVANKRLIHSFTESPRCDNIYRGVVQLKNGTAKINLDIDCVHMPECAMTEGTFEALCVNPTYYLQNVNSFDRVIGDICGNIFTIQCENPQSNDTIHWFVIAERQDLVVKNWDKTNSQGYLITEYASTY